MAMQTLDLTQAQQHLETLTAQERIRWAVEQFGNEAVLLSSMQKTASVLMHMFHTLGLENEILFGDTGFHFYETLQTRDEFIRKYKVNIVTLYPAMTPEQQEAHFGKKLHLYVDGQPHCCKLRKEDPFINYVKSNNKRLVMNGRRRAEDGKRAGLDVISPDPRLKGYAFHPLVDWTDAMVESYIEANQVLVHPLHAKGYPSIGCECCTTPVAPGEDPRAGRWRHLRTADGGPMYCGINFTDGSGI